MSCKKEGNFHPVKDYIILTIITAVEHHKLIPCSFLYPIFLCVECK